MTLHESSLFERSFKDVDLFQQRVPTIPSFHLRAGANAKTVLAEARRASTREEAHFMATRRWNEYDQSLKKDLPSTGCVLLVFARETYVCVRIGALRRKRVRRDEGTSVRECVATSTYRMWNVDGNDMINVIKGESRIPIRLFIGRARCNQSPAPTTFPLSTTFVSHDHTSFRHHGQEIETLPFNC